MSDNLLIDAPKRRGRPPKVRPLVDGETAVDAEDIEDAEDAALPQRVRLVRPYGFIDEHGQNWHWHQGDVVGDPAQVALLIERGAHIEPVG